MPGGFSVFHLTLSRRRSGERIGLGGCHVDLQKTSGL
jgi:hypothetical protein